MGWQQFPRIGRSRICFCRSSTKNLFRSYAFTRRACMSKPRTSTKSRFWIPEAANRNVKVDKLENEIDNLKLDGTKLREENVTLKAEIEQLKFQLQWKQTSNPKTQHKMLAVQQPVDLAGNQPVLVKSVYICLSSILKTLAKIDFTLQSIKLVLDCLGFLPKIWNRSWKVQHPHRLALE